MHIGIDLVEIERFQKWHLKTHTQLSKIFSEQEISYCLQNSHKSAERFAVRFAVKEATYKALCSLLVVNKPFLTVCTALEYHNYHITVKWEKLEIRAQPISVSVSHTHTTAVAVVIIEK